MTPTSDPDADQQVLQHGELTVLGRIRSASNATFLCEAEWEDQRVHCVYKPIAGEQPLWDFPDGTLAGRELASYLISVELGWNIVPYTIIRTGPAGPGMVQRWVDQPEESESGTPDLVDVCAVDAVPPGYLPVLRAYDYAGAEVMLVHADDSRLARMAVFDLLVNNADRKGGHILLGMDGRVYGVDHGLCLHAEDKLRTVLWGWAGRQLDSLEDTAVDGAEDIAAQQDLMKSVTILAERLDDDLAERLVEHVTPDEVDALRVRARDLLETPVMPGPDRHRPIPWPAF